MPTSPSISIGGQNGQNGRSKNFFKNLFYNMSVGEQDIASTTNKGKKDRHSRKRVPFLFIS